MQAYLPSEKHGALVRILVSLPLLMAFAACQEGGQRPPVDSPATVVTVVAPPGPGSAAVPLPNWQVSLANDAIAEQAGTWTLALRFVCDQGRSGPPGVVKLMLTPTSYDERAIMDGASGPVHRRVPLVDQTPLTLAVAVRSEGLVTAVLQRSQEFAAGEYVLTIQDADGRQIGGPRELTLLGDNPIIDRRAVRFK